MKSFNCPDCNWYESLTYNTHDLCSDCMRNPKRSRDSCVVNAPFVYVNSLEKEASALCGICGRPLVKQYSPDYSTTIMKEWFCPHCNEYPSSITYIVNC